MPIILEIGAARGAVAKEVADAREAASRAVGVKVVDVIKEIVAVMIGGMVERDDVETSEDAAEVHAICRMRPMA